MPATATRKRRKDILKEDQLFYFIEPKKVMVLNKNNEKVERNSRDTFIVSDHTKQVIGTYKASTLDELCKKAKISPYTKLKVHLSIPASLCKEINQTKIANLAGFDQQHLARMVIGIQSDRKGWREVTKVYNDLGRNLSRIEVVEFDGKE